MLNLQAKSRTAKGKVFTEFQDIRKSIVKSRIEIDQARLLVLKAAHLIDTVGTKKALSEIAMIKVVCPTMASKVVDRSMQVHGAGGLSQDFPMANFFTWARALRQADGPDIVHIESIAKNILK